MIIAFINVLTMHMYVVMIATTSHYLPLKYHQNAPASSILIFFFFPEEDPQTYTPLTAFGYGLTTLKLLPPALS